MSVEYDENDVLTRLRKLKRSLRVVFAIACAERMLPNYRRFVQEHGFGDAGVLREALDFAWNWIEFDKCDLDVLKSLKRRCHAQIPHTEDFQSVYVSSALDAAISIELILQLLRRQSADIAAEVAMHGIETVGMYVQATEKLNPLAGDFEKKIQSHTLMQIEIAKQYDCLMELESGASTHGARAKWCMPSVGSLGS